ncbi:hypothetical protein KC322_g20564 [Hortaea werneckii]|nr:hypothetical protein KC322_g20564 [Hortaea werneckii]
MLTVSEVADRKKARKLLELKRIALEEAVERSVCEKVYDRIFKHKSTDDEARDEKLRSRTAALAVVGIGLKDLHMDIDRAKLDAESSTQDKEAAIHTSLGDAREALQAMDEEHYPAGKLQHLNAAHKSIVETLSQMFPSSSSADEILPTLIYTLITSPPEGINIVSNLNFIQRFPFTGEDTEARSIASDSFNTRANKFKPFSSRNSQPSNVITTNAIQRECAGQYNKTSAAA